MESIYNYATPIEYLKTEHLKVLNALLLFRKPRDLKIINRETRGRIEEFERKLKHLKQPRPRRGDS